jgi:ADP-heptose:LPS heptosyltransferase
MVLTTPVVRCLKKHYPDAKVHYLTKKQYLPVIGANPNIDRIFTIKESLNEVFPQLKSENYDHVIDLHKNFRSRMVCLKLKRPCSSFNKINVRKWLVVNFKMDRLPDIHIVDRYFEAVEHLGVKNDLGGLDYFIPGEDDRAYEKLPDSHRDKYLGWVIGGKHNTKIYPEEKVIGICREISHPVVLIGGPDDEAAGNRIAEAAGTHVFNACGTFNLNQSASLVKHAVLILTNDTGMMHVAAAFKKQVISFWGNTLPEFGMVPYLPGEEEKSHILQVKGLSCRPCSKLGYKSCPKKHFRCMMDMDTATVVRLLNKL